MKNMKTSKLNSDRRENLLLVLVLKLLFEFADTAEESTAFTDLANSSEFDTLEPFESNVTEIPFNSSADNITEIDLFHNYTFDANATESITEEPPRSPTIVDFDSGVCNCDLKGNVCEVNCCCDEDCSSEDIKVFVECLPQVLPNDVYCYQENIFYKNNTKHKVVSESNSLFCIVRDNLKKKMQFKNLPAFKSLEDFNKLGLKTNFAWELGSEEDIKNVSDIMKAGDLMYTEPIDSERKPSHWRLPSNCFSYACNCEQPVHYMEDISSSCVNIISNLKVDCDQKSALSAIMYTNFCFKDLEGSAFVASIAFNTTEDTTLAYTSTQYSDLDMLCITDTEQLKPDFDSGSGECHNVVSSVRYDIWHNGSSGIMKAMVTFDYTTVSIQTHSLTQNFSVKFHWSKTTEDEYARSGNPGYLFGLPLIAALKQPNNDTLKRLHNGLTILKSSPTGYCSSERETINFGQNLKSGCLMKKNSLSCKNIQNAIFSTLLASFSEQIFVSSFGNSNLSLIDDWVEVFHDSSTYKNEESIISCYLVLSTQIQIAYVAVGPFANPQYKIIGIVHKYGSPELVDFSESDEDLLEDKSMYISTSVNFYDVSEPATAVFRSVPVLSAKLPRDFFYPFLLSSAHCFNTYFMQYMFILVTIIFIS